MFCVYRGSDFERVRTLQEVVSNSRKENHVFDRGSAVIDVVKMLPQSSIFTGFETGTLQRAGRDISKKLNNAA